MFFECVLKELSSPLGPRHQPWICGNHYAIESLGHPADYKKVPVTLKPIFWRCLVSQSVIWWSPNPVHLQRQAAWLCLKTGFEHHTPASACMGTITTQIFEYPILCYLLDFLSVHTRDLSWFYKPPGRAPVLPSLTTISSLVMNSRSPRQKVFSQVNLESSSRVALDRRSFYLPQACPDSVVRKPLQVQRWLCCSNLRYA